MIGRSAGLPAAETYRRVLFGSALLAILMAVLTTRSGASSPHAAASRSPSRDGGEGSGAVDWLGKPQGGHAFAIAQGPNQATDPAQATETPPQPTMSPAFLPVTLRDRILGPVVIDPSNTENLALIGRWDLDGYVESVGFSHDGSIFTWAGRDGIVLFDLVGWRVIRRLPGHWKQTHHTEFTPKDRLLLSGGLDEGGGRIRAWNPRSGREVWSTRVAPEHWGPLFALSPDGQYVVSTTCGSVILHRVHESGLVQVRDLGGGGGLPDMSSDGTIAYFEKGVLLKYTDREGWLHLPAPSERCDASDVDISPNDKLVSAGAMDGIARVWNVADGSVVQQMAGHPGWVWTVAFNADSNLLATGSIDSAVRLWSVKTGQLLRELPSGAEVPAALEFSEDGRFLAVGGGRVVELWAISVPKRDRAALSGTSSSAQRK